MSITDPIANMITLLRNAGNAGKEKVDLKASRVNEDILKILKESDFIEAFKRIPDNKQGVLRAYLKYEEDRNPVIRHIKRISRPGLRVYKKKDDIQLVLGGLGINIISTSQGIVSDQGAREKGLGGEIMIEVW